MRAHAQSSRERYRAYLDKRRKTGWTDESQPSGKAADSASSKPADKSPVDDKGRSLKRSRTFFNLFSELWRSIAGHRLKLAACLCTLTFAVAIGLTTPLSTKIALDYIITDNPGPSGLLQYVDLPPALIADRHALLWTLGGIMIALAVIGLTVGSWGRWQVTALTKRVQAKMRREAFDHAVRLPLHRVYQLKSGGAASVLRDDAGQAAELLFSLIYNPWRAVIQLVGTLVVLAMVDWRMLVGGILLVPCIWLTHKTWIARIRPGFRDIKNTRQNIDSHATETFGGMRVVRGFGQEHGESLRFTKSHHFMARQEMLTWWWSRAIEIAWGLIIPLATVGVMIYAGGRVVDGEVTIGDMMMFTTYLFMLLGPLETLTSTATNIQSNLAGFDRVLDLLEEPTEFNVGPDAIVVSRGTVRGRITLEDVTFAYPRGPSVKPGDAEPAEVVKNATLDVKPGEMIALVGPSGSGKTTLCNLIARFYDPTRGAVRLDGRDLREIEPRSYRSLLGIVEQDVFLFDGTVAENIGYGRRDATLDDVRAAAAAANADGFIDALEAGYDTLIGERGVRLSGGQKQRIAIARALLADPVILILDEATSNLDSESEALIQRSLRQLLKGRTSFVIAHRLSTIRHADRIVVMEAGRIIEMGTHDELMERNGRYAGFLALQTKGSDDDADIPQQVVSIRPKD